MMNIICLIIWVIQLLIGVYNLGAGKPVNPIIYICACLVCICCYISNIIGGE